MKYEVQVGKVVFDVETPYAIQWKAEDEQFLITNENAVKRISVLIRAENQLPENPVKILYRETGVEILEAENGDEVRSYCAMFAAGYPVYAQSRWDGQKINIYYNRKTDIWNHGNMHLWNLIHLEKHLLDTEGMVFHCCYTMYRNQAILFSAPSGTGKTTQAELWKRCYDSEIINGDRCLLQKQEKGWEAWGYPIHGSAQECKNRNLPIRAIVIVRQGKKDKIEELSEAQKLGLLFSESTVNSWDRKYVNQALDLLTDLIKKCTVVMLHCTMNESAAEILHKYLYGEV